MKFGDSMDDLIFYNNNDSSHLGEHYLKLVANEIGDIPIRIQNIIKNESFHSLEDFYKTLYLLIEEHTSTYLFPHDICFFYPSAHYVQATQPIICQISGASIVKGEYYYTYRPLLENTTQKRVYTIMNTIKISSGYETILPQTLEQFENFVSNFNLGLEDIMGINFAYFQSNAGDNILSLKELPKQKQKHR